MDRDHAYRGGYIYGRRDALREVKAMIGEMDVFVAKDPECSKDMTMRLGYLMGSVNQLAVAAEKFAADLDGQDKANG